MLPKGLRVPERALKQRNEQVQDGNLGISNWSNPDYFASVAPLQGAGCRLTARSQDFADGKPSSSTLGFSPHFSQNCYCGDGSTRPDCVPLHRPSRRTLRYDCEGLSRVALSGRYLHRLATQLCEKCGLIVHPLRGCGDHTC